MKEIMNGFDFDFLSESETSAGLIGEASKYLEE